VEYLSDQYDLGLLPKDPYERAKGKIVIDIVDKKIIPAYFRIMQSQEPEKQESAKEELTAALKEFAEKLPKDDGPFYSGKKFGFVDIQLVPWVLRFNLVCEFANRDCLLLKGIEISNSLTMNLFGRGSENGLMLSVSETVW
jgi:glutathione S-transferase